MPWKATGRPIQNCFPEQQESGLKYEMHTVAYATQETGRELCQSFSCSGNIPRGGSNNTATVKVMRPWENTGVLLLRKVVAAFGLGACIERISGSSCRCSKIPFWQPATCSSGVRTVSYKDLWECAFMAAWIEANTLTSPLWGEKKGMQPTPSRQNHLHASRFWCSEDIYWKIWNNTELSSVVQSSHLLYWTH